MDCGWHIILLELIMRFPTAILFQEDKYITFLEPSQEVLFGFQGAVASLCRLLPGYNAEGVSPARW
jgi:hypothetical protein